VPTAIFLLAQVEKDHRMRLALATCWPIGLWIQRAGPMGRIVAWAGQLKPSGKIKRN